MALSARTINLRRFVLPVTAVALLVCYASTLRGMVEQWTEDEDMAHGFFVPLVILWVVWRERARWRPLAAEPSAWGYAVLSLGAGLDFAGALGAGLFARSLGLLVSAAGVVLCLGGVRWLRVLAFPFGLAFFMLPKLAVVYNQATLPLQLLATRLAATLLTAARFTVVREGNILNVAGHNIAVVEACDGIRYLIPLVFTALVFGYLRGSTAAMRIALACAAVPIAIVANGVRVAAAGPLPALTGGPLHAAAGWLIFVLSLGLLGLLPRLFEIVSPTHRA